MEQLREFVIDGPVSECLTLDCLTDTSQLARAWDVHIVIPECVLGDEANVMEDN